MSIDSELMITAFGAATPIGGDYSEIKRALLNGISGIKENKKFNCSHYTIKHAGIPEEGNDTIKWPSSKKYVGELFYAQIAAQRLKAHYLFPKNFYPENRLGCIIGVDEPPFDLQLCFNMFASESNKYASLNKKHVLNYLVENLKISESNAFEPSTVLNVIYREIPFSGYSNCHLGLCSASLQAMGMACHAIKYGVIDAAIVGGVSGKVNPLNLAKLELVEAISLNTDLSPTQRSRPFDKRRSGFVLAEGGILFLIEKKCNVHKRREKGLLKLLGYGSSLGAQHIVIPHTESLEMELSMRRALANANITPQEIDLINAHATSTILNDLHESLAINKVFGMSGAQDIKVVANKSLHGHLIAAAGAMEVLNTLIFVNEGFLPGTINLDEQDEKCKVNVVKNTEVKSVSLIMKNSFGMGGGASSVVLGRVGG